MAKKVEPVEVLVETNKCNKLLIKYHREFSTGKASPCPVTKWLVLSRWDGAFCYSKFQRNRDEEKGQPEKYQKEMEEGRWEETHQGFAFDYDGRSIDCWHRSKALMNCNETVRIRTPVTFGLNPKVFAVIDGGKVRGAKANIKVGTGDSVSRVDIQIVSFLCQGKKAANGLFDASKAAHLYGTHKDALLFVKEHLSHCYNGPVGGAVARAYYHKDIRPYLPDFCSGLLSVTTDEDPRGGGARAKIYQIATEKIAKFVEKKTGRKVLKKNQEIPLPDEFNV